MYQQVEGRGGGWKGAQCDRVVERQKKEEPHVECWRDRWTGGVTDGEGITAGGSRAGYGYRQ